MTLDRGNLIVVGNDAFSNESFSKLIAKLIEKFEITYLPDLSCCLSRVRQAIEHVKLGTKDPVAACELFLFSDFTDASELQALVTLLPKARLMGYPAFVQCMLSQGKWIKPRPVFNFSMLGAMVCITGYRDRHIVNRLATMINWMGGSVQRYLNVTTTTHLVAYRCAGEKVRSAALATRRIATVKASWVEEAWSRRTDQPCLNATEVEFVAKHRTKVFQETCLAFVGFVPGSDELTEMCNLVTEYDGLLADSLHDQRLTHVVVTDAWPGHGNILEQLKELLVSADLSRMSPISAANKGITNVPVVRASGSPSLTEKDQYRVSVLGPTYRVPVLRLEWFWLSVQLTCLCRLEHYLYVAGPPRSHSIPKPQLPPLARPGASLGPIEPTDVPGPSSSWSTTTSTLSPALKLTTALPDITEPIEEEDDETSPSKPTAPQSLSDSEVCAVAEDKENWHPYEAHSLDSPFTLLKGSPACPVRVSDVNVLSSPRGKHHSPLLCTPDKVCFITSPSRHRNSPRGFVSPSSVEAMSHSGGRLSHARRGKTSSLGCMSGSSSSHDDLLTQLADPLSLPSNRERHLCQLTASRSRLSQQLTTSVVSDVVRTSAMDDHPPPSSGFFSWSPNSFNSGLLLNATNTSDHTMNNQSTGSCLVAMAPGQGLYSLVGSLREVLSGDEVTASDPTDQTVSDTVKSPVLHITDASGTPLHLRLEKRQHRVFEFFVTERNYLDILRYLYRVAYPQVIEEEQSGGAILPRQEADYIFGKLGPIVELHERLQPQLNQLEASWSLSESRLGDVLRIELLDEMDKAYGNYMQFYSPPHMQRLGEQFPRFLAFMRQVERRKESGRQSLAALLVRPIQRLPSIALLMDGIAKFTPISHPDHVAVHRFATGLNDLLTNINARLRKNEERLSLLSLYHEISGAPPEMLSSSRVLVARLNVFELGTSTSGNTTCEPITLFLLSDSLEVARPRKRHTGEPIAHAIRAALAAVQGDGGGVEANNNESYRDPALYNFGEISQLATPGHCVDSAAGVGGGGGAGGSTITVTRTGSGASGSSMMNLGLVEGKQRCHYKHLHLLKLHEIKRVVNFDTASPDRAAFGLVVRSSSEIDDRVYAYCLAASFAASAAVASGRCPEPVESAVAAAVSASGVAQSASSSQSHVATLQACVSEAKRVFLHRLCHHIIQVSCLANSPDELLVDVQPEELLGFDLEQVFNATALALKSKKFSRQLTRNISIKTPRRPVGPMKQRPITATTPLTPSCTQSTLCNPAATMDTACNPAISSPRRSVLSSWLGHRGNTGPGDSCRLTADSTGAERLASTPLQDRRMCAPAHPPPTPTADQVAMAMLNLIRAPHSLSQPPSIRETTAAPVPSLYDDDEDGEDYGGDYPDADCASIASSNFGVNCWPAYVKQSNHWCPEVTLSSTSLRSNTLDMNSMNVAMDGVSSLRTMRTSSQPPIARNSLCRHGPFGRTSALLSDHDIRGQRKSVCQSVLAGLKNFRRSIAGASSSLLHGNTTGSFVGSSLNRVGRTAPSRSREAAALSSPGILNRSASVDAGVCANIMLAAASPLTSTGDLCLSGLSLNRPAPLAETELERDAESPIPASFIPTRNLCPPSCASIHSNAEETRPMFPRSMTAGVSSQGGHIMTPNSNSSFRNLFSSALRNQASNLTHCSSQLILSSVERKPPCSQPAPDCAKDIIIADDGNLDSSNLMPYTRLGGSMMSLTSWDSVATLDIPTTSNGGAEFRPARSQNPTGSAVWETASHLGVSTHEDMRRSFRLPFTRHLPSLGQGHEASKKVQKKSKKHKLPSLSNLFQKPSSTVTNVLRPINQNDSTKLVSGSESASAVQLRQMKFNPSRRESLLRGIFSR
ncbi:hypothetical protein EG68_01905 [Paragonimus skrjabini miyazakii]|uniref:Protein ECT2 n=1 Tax=Paragonimus skrjabini miyazakii TaxID=59628 RepID=A0A8S9Z5W0_9TREM|nr:hypothetical protein EG68_01905 [Paragonimus skrjabini miyazakii]